MMRAAVAVATVGLMFAGLGLPTATASPSGKIVVSASPADSGDLAPGNPLRLFVSLNNASTQTSAVATATVSVGSSPVSSRTDLASWFADAKGAVAPTQVGATPFPAVGGGAEEGIDVSIPASALPWSASGVYPVLVTVSTATATLGTAETAIAWNVTSSAPVPVAIAVPITVPAGASAFLSATELAGYTAPGGVLTRELDDVQDAQIALGIDPRILASIRILGKSAPQTALTWLDELEALPNETFPLAWADADLTAPLHAGEAAVLQPKPLDYAINPSLFPATQPATPTPSPTPGTVTTPVVPTSASLVQFNYTLPTLSWPRENSVVSADLPKLAKAGVRADILSSGNVKQSDSRGLSGASATVGTTAVAVSDDVLSGYLRTAIQSPVRASSADALTELTTSLALVDLASGSAPRTVLLTLGRNWANSDTNFERSVTQLYARAWTTGATVSSLFGGSSEAVKLVPQNEPADRIALVAKMLASEGSVVSFAPIAKVPDAVTSSTRLQLLAALSNEWTNAAWPAAGEAFVTAATKVTNSVQVVPSSEALAFANRTALPVTVSNNLDQDVTVTLEVRSRAALLSVDKAARSQSVTVDEDSQRRIQIPISAISNVNAEIVATLYSATGVQIGRAVTIRVNVNAGWETTGTLIFAALVVGLFAFGIVRNIRKRRKAAVVE
jgi:hypothetical protein